MKTLLALMKTSSNQEPLFANQEILRFLLNQKWKLLNEMNKPNSFYLES